jgi:hypothetical protein
MIPLVNSSSGLQAINITNRAVRERHNPITSNLAISKLLWCNSLLSQPEVRGPEGKRKILPDIPGGFEDRESRFWQ